VFAEVIEGEKQSEENHSRFLIEQRYTLFKSFSHWLFQWVVFVGLKILEKKPVYTLEKF
jgi:hypothetical protein